MLVAIIIIILIVLWALAALMVVALCVSASEGDRQLSGDRRRRELASRRVRLGRTRFVPQR